MQIKRIIPVLLIHKGLLYKTKNFKEPRYIGDPINTVRIFNEKEVDEIIILDIDATVNNKGPNFDQIREIAGEAFMPLSYGGGISNLDQVKKVIDQGVEKIILSHSALENHKIISDAAKQVGSSSTVVCIDIKKKLFSGYDVYTRNGKNCQHKNILKLVKEIEDLGAGELVINSIDRDGTMEGYDVKLIKTITDLISIPVVACGGAGSIDDLSSAFNAGATGAAAGSLFVFHGKHKAVLITYPSQNQILNIII